MGGQVSFAGCWAASNSPADNSCWQAGPGRCPGAHGVSPIVCVCRPVRPRPATKTGKQAGHLSQRGSIPGLAAARLSAAYLRTAMSRGHSCHCWCRKIDPAWRSMMLTPGTLGSVVVQLLHGLTMSLIGSACAQARATRCSSALPIASRTSQIEFPQQYVQTQRQEHHQQCAEAALNRRQLILAAAVMSSGASSLPRHAAGENAGLCLHSSDGAGVE